jgi:hypothetical protein
VAFVTAFDADAANGLDTPNADEQVRAWPTIFLDRITVSLTSGRSITRIELLDAQGRVACTPAIPTSTHGVLSIATPTLSPGPYLLRVNSRWTIKLMHE